MPKPIIIGEQLSPPPPLTREMTSLKRTHFNRSLSYVYNYYILDHNLSTWDKCLHGLNVPFFGGSTS